MTKKMKRNIIRILISIVLLIVAVIITELIPDLSPNIQLLLFVVSYVVIGHDVIKQAGQNIIHGQVFDENFLMTIATFGAFVVGEYPEAVFVMIFYQVGELFQSYAVNKSRKSITDLMDIRPDSATVIRDGAYLTVDPEQVEIGEVIFVRPGEKIPLDGIVLKGNTTLDTKALTGESVPREVLTGDEIISGCVNITSAIEITVTKAFGESTVSKILDLVENASSKKAQTENFITRFAVYYTPIVVVAAVLISIIPPMLFQGEWYDWMYRGLSFLVVSCPCALVISVPLSFFGGLGGAGRKGILVKGSNYLEALAKTEIVVFDKTGTLTKGTFEVSDVVINEKSGLDKEGLLELAAHVESHSNHPISRSLLRAYGKEISQERIGKISELAGMGIVGEIDGTMILAGNHKLMEQEKISFFDVAEIGTVIHIARGNEYLGYILVSDEVKEDAKRAISELEKMNISQVVMLTGDREETAEHVARSLGIKKVFSHLLPIDKVERMEVLLQEKGDKGKLVFVGDGMNDAPVLARADIGVAMGGLGSDAAIEAADIVIMTDEPSKLGVAINISKKTLQIVKQNIVFALSVKAIVLILAAIGFASMWAAVFADVGVAFLAILNAMRAMYYKEK